MVFRGFHKGKFSFLLTITRKDLNVKIDSEAAIPRCLELRHVCCKGEKRCHCIEVADWILGCIKMVYMVKELTEPSRKP